MNIPDRAGEICCQIATTCEVVRDTASSLTKPGPVKEFLILLEEVTTQKNDIDAIRSRLADDPKACLSPKEKRLIEKSDRLERAQRNRFYLTSDDCVHAFSELVDRLENLVMIADGLPKDLKLMVLSFEKEFRHLIDPPTGNIPPYDEMVASLSEWKEKWLQLAAVICQFKCPKKKGGTQPEDWLVPALLLFIEDPTKTYTSIAKHEEVGTHPGNLGRHDVFKELKRMRKRGDSIEDLRRVAKVTLAKLKLDR